MIYILCLNLLAVALTQGAPLRDDMERETWDLTHPFGKDTIYWPTADPNYFNLTTVFKGQFSPKLWVSMNRYNAEEHGGTHIDAPYHMNPQGKTVDQIHPEDLSGPAVLIDIEEKAKRDRNAKVERKDIENWEKGNGMIPKGALVIMYSGWSHKWGNKTAYRGTDKTGSAGAADLNFPGFQPEAVQFILNERSINGIGVDTPSVDIGAEKDDFLVHRILFTKNKYGLENLKILKKWPAKGAMMTALPLMIEGGSGGPCRVIVNVPKCKRGKVWSTCSATRPSTFFLTVIFLSFLARYFN